MPGPIGTILDVDLKEKLTAPPRIASGFQRIPYPTDQFDLRGRAVAHARKHGRVEEPQPLETLHRRVAPELQAWQPNANALDSDEFCKHDASFREEYHRFVRWIAREVLGFDVLFEASPNLRYHFPIVLPDHYRSKSGQLLAYHVDTLFAEPFEQINCWLPLTKCFGQNALNGAGLSDSLELLEAFCSDLAFDYQTYVTTGRRQIYDKMFEDEAFGRTVIEACKPMLAEHGELIMFDSRTVHGTCEHPSDDHTRVSIDFRLLPVDDYDAMCRRYERAGLPLPLHESYNTPIGRAGFYHEKSAFEL